jgi:phosphodiesterase/alkaline phosphatase D-like protein
MENKYRYIDGTIIDSLINIGDFIYYENVHPVEIKLP